MPVSLPRETLEQILEDKNLDQATLANCCRLSKNWVDFIRPRLYRRLTFRVTDSEEAGGQRWEDTKHHYTFATLSLVMSLRKHEYLSSLVREAQIQDLGASRHPLYLTGDEMPNAPSGFATTILSLFSTVLYTCPELEELGLPARTRMPASSTSVGSTSANAISHLHAHYHPLSAFPGSALRRIPSSRSHKLLSRLSSSSRNAVVAGQ
jgi:hypothetical protein